MVSIIIYIIVNLIKTVLKIVKEKELHFEVPFPLDSSEFVKSFDYLFINSHVLLLESGKFLHNQTYHFSLYTVQ